MADYRAYGKTDRKLLQAVRQKGKHPMTPEQHDGPHTFIRCPVCRTESLHPTEPSCWREGCPNYDLMTERMGRQPMTAEQRDSKTEGRGELIRTALEYAARYCDLQAEKWAREATRPQSDQDRLDREFRSEAEENEKAFKDRAHKMRMAAATPSPQSPPEPGRGDMLARQERMAELGRRIAHLSSIGINEGGGELCPTCEASYEQTSIFHKPKNACPTCGAPSPSDLPAREAIERAMEALRPFASLANRVDALEPSEGPSSEYDDISGVMYGDLVDARNALACLAIELGQPLSQGNGEAVARSNVQPFAWVYRDPGSKREHLTWQAPAPPYIDIRPLYAAPPSKPEGVREALGGELLKWAEQHAQFVTSRKHADIGDDDRALLRQAANALTTTPSRGLVEAAEWPELTNALKALDEAGGAALGIAMSTNHPNADEVLTNIFHSCNKASGDLRKALRTSAKGGAGAD